jgi:hypothetical protein
MFRGRFRKEPFFVLFFCSFILIQDAIPCGPSFPEQVLTNREGALFEEITGDFYVDIHQLIPKGKERSFFVDAATREELEKKQLSEDMFTLLTSVRALKDSDTAYAKGEKLPESIRVYTAGAVGYHNGQFLQAIGYFNKVLALEKEDKQRAVWATYMLAKIAYLQDNSSVAETGFQDVRKLILMGFPDPLGLAASSYGEEARIYYKALDYAKAFALYAKQVSYGSSSGINSIKIALVQLMNEDDIVIEKTTHDAFARNLIILYAHSYLGGYDNRIDEYSTDEERKDLKIKTAKEDKFLASIIKKTLAQSQDEQIFQLKVAGWLAANRYARGDFELASQLVKFDKSALSQWIKAKLALRKGDLNTAHAALSQAISRFPIVKDDNSTQAERFRRLNAEYGILKLGRKDYLQALKLFYINTDSWDYWRDVAHIAERVLTLNELKIFVDQYVPSLSEAQMVLMTKADKGEEAFYEALENSKYGSYFDEIYDRKKIDKDYFKKKHAITLRAILARRMLRNGLLDDALVYFDKKTLRTIAKQYVDALESANSQWSSDVTRAKAWYQAAVIAKNNGMEILGFELTPDEAFLDGSYSTESDKSLVIPFQANTFTSADEQTRCEQSVATPDLRFHYRLVAADYMLKAANLVPQSSQAFAAILCQSTGWNLVRYPEYGQAAYKKYLKEGAYVPWASHFGDQCQHPNFESAKTRVWTERYQTIKSQLRPYKYIIYFGVFVSIGIFILILWRMKGAKIWRNNG